MTYQELVEQIQNEANAADVSGITEHLAYQINIEGEANGAFYIEVKDGKLDIQPYEYYDRDAIIFTSAENILKMVKGKLNPVSAFLTGKIRVEGDLGKAAMLEKILKSK